MDGSSNSRLSFDPEYHAYWWDGQHYVPSSTQILDDNGWVSNFCKSKDHAIRGNDIHEMINLDIIRRMDGRRLKKQYKERLGQLIWAYNTEYFQFENFCLDLKPIFLDTESRTYGYLPENETDIPDWAGTTDISAIINGSFCRIDMKTGATIPEHARLQLASYVLGDFPIDYDTVGRFALRINSKYKQYKLVAYSDNADYEEWRDECRRHRRNNPR